MTMKEYINNVIEFCCSKLFIKFISYMLITFTITFIVILAILAMIYGAATLKSYLIILAFLDGSLILSYIFAIAIVFLIWKPNNK